MSEKPKPGVIASLPSTRPHRRSDKRTPPPAEAVRSEPVTAKPKPASADPARPKREPKPASADPARPKREPKPAAAPAGPKRAMPAAARTHAADRPRTQPRPAAPQAPGPSPPGALQTAVQAAAELTEIGLRAGARALRVTLSRLPKP